MKPSVNDLKFWQGTLFTKDDWDFNFSKIVSWLADGNSDLIVNSIKSVNGVDMDGAQIINVGTATEGSQAVNLNQALSLLNRSSYYYPFSVASGTVDSYGNSNFLLKNSDTQVTVLAGNTNPELVCISSDGTIESLTDNVVLTIPAADGTYHIIKEKEQAVTVSGATSKITVGKVEPTGPAVGDYWLDNSVVPFVGRKYTGGAWTDDANLCPFCWLGDVVVSSGSATVYTRPYNNNEYNVLITDFWTDGTQFSITLLDKFCIQWGGNFGEAQQRQTTVNLHTAYKDKDSYRATVTFNVPTNDASVNLYIVGTVDKDVSSFKVMGYKGSSDVRNSYDWITIGVIK